MGSELNAPKTVLFVGRRRAAFDAARALGLAVVCVDEKPPGRGAGPGVRFLHHDLDPQADWARVAEAVSGDRSLEPDGDWNRSIGVEANPRGAGGRTSEDRPIAAVYALTERAVEPAARLRRALGQGDGVATARRVTDKLAMKRAIRAAGLACARFVDAERGLSPAELIAELGLPMVQKARVGSGGRLTRLCLAPGEVRRLDPGWMAEAYVDGVEMSVETLVAGGQPIFTNPTEYFRVRWANIVPAALEPATLRAVEDLNARTIEALGVEEGFTHLELFLTPDGPIFSELAQRPPGGHITDLIALAYGFDPWQAWLRLGLGERPELPAAATRTAGVWIFHPGPGTVAEIAGVDTARALPGVHRLALRLRPGDRVAERVGAGQEAGHVVVTGRDRDQVARRLERAYRAVRIMLA